jgi:hypothetical protein
MIIAIVIGLMALNCAQMFALAWALDRIEKTRKHNCSPTSSTFHGGK